MRKGPRRIEDDGPRSQPERSTKHQPGIAAGIIPDLRIAIRDAVANTGEDAIQGRNQVQNAGVVTVLSLRRKATNRLGRDGRHFGAS